MEIESSRLLIIPLTLPQFKLLLTSTAEMEENLHLNSSHQELDADTHDAMSGLYAEAVKHPGNYFWYTNWQIIIKNKKLSIGSACFMKEPDETGKAEIGYGINEPFRNQGYMSEALQAICGWAKQQNYVKIITAETESDSPASQKVLSKCGFQIMRKEPHSYYWEYVLNK